MSFKREQHEEKRHELRGSLSKDGRWLRTWNDPTYTEREVMRFVRARRASQLSPAQLAEQIEASPVASAFQHLPQWKTLTEWRLWSLASTSNAAEELVKRMGNGTDGHWQQGAWLPGDDERDIHAIPAPPEAREALAALWKSLETGAAS